MAMGSGLGRMGGQSEAAGRVMSSRVGRCDEMQSGGSVEGWRDGASERASKQSGSGSERAAQTDGRKWCL